VDVTEPHSQSTRTSSLVTAAQPAQNKEDNDSLSYSTISDGTYPGSPPSTPRWVKVFGIGVVVLGLLFAGLHLTGNMSMSMHDQSSG
jgi:hypothetical protein